ncbi:MAG: hypothetical protein IRZ21_05665 [Thermoleophilaceae bacterium]|nr:hypothetical protein [Thermoleophilaceae bacterium]
MAGSVVDEVGRRASSHVLIVNTAAVERAAAQRPAPLRDGRLPAIDRR